eukprot:SM000114S24154  [mRNA]  locus=s114:262071:267559:- [translate_table: standard]
MPAAITAAGAGGPPRARPREADDGAGVTAFGGDSEELPLPDDQGAERKEGGGEEGADSDAVARPPQATALQGSGGAADVLKAVAPTVIAHEAGRWRRGPAVVELQGVAVDTISKAEPAVGLVAATQSPAEQAQDEAGAGVDGSGSPPTPEPSPGAPGRSDGWDPTPFLDDATQRRQRLGPACDLAHGKWVYDPASRPLYTAATCPHMDRGFDCSSNGRTDVDYMNFRWQPAACDLPRFDAATARQQLQGRRVVFVGDSIGRNQFQSFLCMLMAGLDDGAVYEKYGNPITKHEGYLVFVFRDHNLTVEFFRSPFLVLQTRPPSSSSIPAKVQSVIKLDVPDRKWGQFAAGADVVVFNNGHWFTHSKTIGAGHYFSLRGAIRWNLTVEDAYERSMYTIVDWVRRNSSGSHAFFRSYSPVHFRFGGWLTGGVCNETHPVWDDHEHEDAHPFENITRRALARMRAPLTYLDVTYLSRFRVDGHMNIKARYLASAILSGLNPFHWCLPGVPDAWNEVLHANLLLRLVATGNSNRSPSVAAATRL